MARFFEVTKRIVRKIPRIARGIGSFLFLLGKIIYHFSIYLYKFGCWGLNAYRTMVEKKQNHRKDLVENVFAAHEKIKKGDITGRKELEVIKVTSDEESVNDVLKEIQTWDHLRKEENDDALKEIQAYDHLRQEKNNGRKL